MRTAPMTLQQAARRAGAEHIALRPDGHGATNGPDLALYRHCGRPMTETLNADRQPVRYICDTCGTDITHIDGHGTPAPITPHQRQRAEQSGELWTIGSNPNHPLTSRGPAGTSHH